MAYSRKKPARKAPKVRTTAKKATRSPSENEIQMKCWQWVVKTYPPLLIFHVANERQAAIQYHIKLKRLGVRRGIADFLAFPNDGRKIAIELKDDQGTQDKDQILFQRCWEHTGGLYFLVRTLEEFQGVIDAVMLFMR